MLKLFICFVFLAYSNFARANEAQLGLILGSITGISGKYDLGGNRAIDAALAYSVDGQYGIALHTDYLFNPAQVLTLGRITPVSLYYGVGIRLIEYRDRNRINGNTRLGMRFPIGLFYRTSNPDLELFGELAPILDVTPRTDVYIDVGIGVRLII